MLEDSKADNLTTLVLKLRVENQLKEAVEKSAPLICASWTWTEVQTLCCLDQALGRGSEELKFQD